MPVRTFQKRNFHYPRRIREHPRFAEKIASESGKNQNVMQDASQIIRREHPRGTEEHQVKMNNWESRKQENFHLLLRYNCRFCGMDSPRVLHPSNFLQTCRKCNSISHLKELESSFKFLYGAYECQERRCGSNWVQRLPFKNIILNTPVCSRCQRLTKVRQIFFRRNKVTFKNSLLYKCENCSKFKTISLLKATQKGRETLTENPELRRFPTNPKCDACQVPMIFLKNLKSIFTLALDGNERPRPESFSPTNNNFSKRNSHGPRREDSEIPKSEGDSKKEEIPVIAKVDSPNEEIHVITESDINNQN